MTIDQKSSIIIGYIMTSDQKSLLSTVDCMIYDHQVVNTGIFLKKMKYGV